MSGFTESATIGVTASVLAVEIIALMLTQGLSV
jgi:hypothetical protein